MRKPKPRPGIMDIELYIGEKSTVKGMPNILKLSSNENPSGPPLAAQQALISAGLSLHRYPPSDHWDLRSAIAEIHGLDISKIICGCGSDELISLLCRAYAGPGVEVIHTSHGFLMYRICAMAAGATVVSVPEEERHVDVDAILNAINSSTGIIFIANPGNPTGTKILDVEIERLIKGTPKDVLVVLDGAYADYVNGWDGGAKFVESHTNVVMLRTLSKMYGLGGLRVGWGYAPQHILNVLDRVRAPFNLSVPALLAGEAAVKDKEFVNAHRKQNNAARKWLAAELLKVGVQSDPSEANFILARFSDQAQAEACDDYLQSIGVLVRRVGSYGLPNALRITVPDMAGCQRVITGVKSFFGGNSYEL